MPTLDWDRRKCIKNCQPEFLRATIAYNVKIPKLWKEDINRSLWRFSRNSENCFGGYSYEKLNARSKKTRKESYQ